MRGLMAAMGMRTGNRENCEVCGVECNHKPGRQFLNVDDKCNSVKHSDRDYPCIISTRRPSSLSSLDRCAIEHLTLFNPYVSVGIY